MRVIKSLFVVSVVLAALAFACPGYANKRDITFSTVGNEGRVVFSHEDHLQKHDLMCKQCHPGLFRMKAGSDGPVTMSAMADGKFCGACHDGGKAFDANSDSECDKCHEGGAGYSKDGDNADEQPEDEEE